MKKLRSVSEANKTPTL